MDTRDYYERMAEEEGVSISEYILNRAKQDKDVSYITYCYYHKVISTDMSQYDDLLRLVESLKDVPSEIKHFNECFRGYSKKRIVSLKKFKWLYDNGYGEYTLGMLNRLESHISGDWHNCESLFDEIYHFVHEFMIKDIQDG